MGALAHGFEVARLERSDDLRQALSPLLTKVSAQLALEFDVAAGELLQRFAVDSPARSPPLSRSGSRHSTTCAELDGFAEVRIHAGGEAVSRDPRS